MPSYQILEYILLFASLCSKKRIYLMGASLCTTCSRATTQPKQVLRVQNTKVWSWYSRTGAVRSGGTRSSIRRLVHSRNNTHIDTVLGKLQHTSVPPRTQSLPHIISRHRHSVALAPTPHTRIQACIYTQAEARHNRYLVQHTRHHQHHPQQQRRKTRFVSPRVLNTHHTPQIVQRQVFTLCIMISTFYIHHRKRPKEYYQHTGRKNRLYQ